MPNIITHTATPPHRFTPPPSKSLSTPRKLKCVGAWRGGGGEVGGLAQVCLCSSLRVYMQKGLKTLACYPRLLLHHKFTLSLPHFHCLSTSGFGSNHADFYLPRKWLTFYFSPHFKHHPYNLTSKFRWHIVNCALSSHLIKTPQYQN